MKFLPVIFALSCAVVVQSTEGHIIDGTSGRTVEIKNYPYTVSVQDPVKHICSGVIISERFVLSAASLLNEKFSKINTLTVHAGSSSVRNGSVHGVKDIYYHNFMFNQVYSVGTNNIALIELKDPIVFDETRQAINMFDLNENVKSNVTGIVSGWPAINGIVTEQLLIATVTIVDGQICNNAHGDWHEIAKNEICVVGDNEDFKNIDMGSPLVVDGRLAGIASLVVTGETDPKFFSSVAHHRNWINKQIQMK